MDKQRMTARLESSLYDQSQLQFVPITPGGAQRDYLYANAAFETSVVGWRVLDTLDTVAGNYYLCFNDTYSQFDLSVRVQRLPGFYELRVVLSVWLLVMMGLLSSTLRADVPERSVRDNAGREPGELATGTRLRGHLRFNLPSPNLQVATLTVFVGIVSYVFVEIESTPQTSTFTRLDAFMSLR
jgi:hypothetical protein